MAQLKYFEHEINWIQYDMASMARIRKPYDDAIMEHLLKRIMVSKGRLYKTEEIYSR